MRIAVIDGQGGGIGSLIVKRLREEFSNETLDISAFGTNAMATTSMLKAHANRAATGENAIVLNAGRVDVIIGTLSTVMANSMMGELTAKMAEAIASSSARKILLPINQEGVEVIGIAKEPLPHMVEAVVERIKEIVAGSACRVVCTTRT